MCSRHAVEVFPLLRFYQILSWKKKEKIFIRGLSKQYGLASQGFLVVRGVRPEKFQFLEKWQNRNFDDKFVI